MLTTTKVHLLYESGYIILCVGNLMEEKSSVCVTGLPKGI